MLADNIRCTACGQQAGDPDKDAVVLAKLTESLGAHFYLCTSCEEVDSRLAGHPG